MALDRSSRLDYSGLGCQCRLNKGGILFRRTRYQQGSLRLEERKRGAAVWVYRWWENDITGKPIRRKVQLGCLERYPNESAACAAVDALRLTINNQSKRNNLRKTTVNILWEHYCREELLLKEISTQDAYLVYAKNWILPRWGKLLLEEIKTIEVESLATSSTNYRRDQSQDKVRYVGGVLARCSLGILWPQSNFVGNTSWNRRKERAKHWRARQCETSEVSLSAVTRRSQTRSDAAGISRPASRVFGGRLGNPSRGTWGTALAGLRVRKHEFQCATFLLLASGWAPEEHKDGSVGKVIADAPESEAGLVGMEVTKSLQPAGRFRLPFGETEGQQTTRLGFGVEEKDSTGVQEDRYHGSGLAHISAHGGNHAGRDGRTPTNDPGLLAPCEFARNQQVSLGNNNEQAFGTGKAGGRHSARGRAIGKQINSGPLGSPRGNLIGPKWTQIVFGGSA